MSKLILSEKEKLQGIDNFPIWYSIMMDYLRAKKLTKYITYNLNNMLKKPTSNENLTPEDSDFNENLEAKDAMPCTIILTNVYDKIKTYIKDCIKDVQETMNVTNKIMELFRLLNDSPTKPTNIEKIIIMHDTLPNDLKSKVIFSSKLTPEQFYEEIKDKFTVLTYKNDRQKIKSIHSNGDIPDLNNIENKKRNMIQRKTKNKMRKYCVICNKKGHLAKDCYFNPCGTKRNNKKCIFNKNLKKKLNNTKIDEENYKDKTPYYDEMQTMFGSSINNLEHDEGTTQNEDNYTIWTYDTGPANNIIRRIKLAKSGINIRINNINEKISLTLTNNNNKIIDIIFPDQFNIVRIKATNKFMA
ncbi:hypothetical protein H8356DRAFT_1361509 [Neocallimastix lanati (nom. inval.)]|nr:hypothetical protein H8356DRAFT_1361509 [Neocallimastix sp. JGI-2020a]